LIFDNTKYILREGAKVSTLVDIRQHKIYFTDYWNRNKSSQKVGVATGGGTIPPPILGGVMGKAPIVHNLKSSKWRHRNRGRLADTVSEFPCLNIY
jgi:hypothetical protein